MLLLRSRLLPHIHHKPTSLVVLSGLSVSQCVNRGEASRQLEWVLLEAHFALLQRLIQQDRSGEQRRLQVAKRSQALVALIRLTSIAPCQELLDMQEKVGRKSKHNVCEDDIDSAAVVTDVVTTVVSRRASWRW